LGDTLMEQPRRISVLGVQVDAVTLDRATEILGQCIHEGRRIYVCVTGVHGVMESQLDGALLDIHNSAGLVVPDGMPLVWMSRLYGKPQAERICGRDLMRRMTAISAERGYRQFYYGSSEPVSDRLKQVLSTQYPGLSIADSFCPPFRPLTPEEDTEIVERINAARPDILWIGLSTPKQERWMASHLHKLDVPVMIGVGAAFDFLAGTVPEAPTWMQRSGLEWLYRLCSEPQRLGPRYAYIVPMFMALAAVEVARDALLALLAPLRASPQR
jgi:N-acetylglucosaminyldiphosphoundecaprenol N-acetyl-beta-D-mannosaminyltransferase